MIFPKIARRKAPTKQTYRLKTAHQCDALLKLIILERDGNKCCRCGVTEKLQSAHVLPKGTYPRMRFMELNLLILCLRCHLFVAHKDPVGFADWFREKFPGRYEQLLLWTRQAPKVDVKQLLIELKLRTKETHVTA